MLYTLKEHSLSTNDSARDIRKSIVGTRHYHSLFGWDNHESETRKIRFNDSARPPQKPHYLYWRVNIGAAQVLLAICL